MVGGGSGWLRFVCLFRLWPPAELWLVRSLALDFRRLCWKLGFLEPSTTFYYKSKVECSRVSTRIRPGPFQFTTWMDTLDLFRKVYIHGWELAYGLQKIMIHLVYAHVCMIALCLVACVLDTSKSEYDPDQDRSLLWRIFRQRH
jgi:hypothetical protein